MQYLIVGNSAAGLSAARSIRTGDREGKITLFSDGVTPTILACYSLILSGEG